MEAVEAVEGNGTGRRGIRFRETGGRGGVLGRIVMAGWIEIAVG